jgi:hypothetical protein
MKGSRTATVADELFAALSALVPACLVASHAGHVADAAHDRGVARVLGLEPQLWRSLDVLVGMVLAPLPVGTREGRAALGGALVVGATGYLLYTVARRLLAACAETRTLGPLVAAIAAITPLVSAPWQIEGAAVGGSVTGALLALAPVAVLLGGGSAPDATPDARTRTPSAPLGALLLGLALGHEPLVGLCAVAGVAAVLASDPHRRQGLAKEVRAQPAMLAAALVGLAPWAVALARSQASGAHLLAALAEGWAGERALSPAGSPSGLVAFVAAEMGTMFSVLAVAGGTLALLLPAARPAAGGLLGVAVAGFASAWIGAPLGPTRFGAPLLAAFVAASGLAAVAMQALVRAVSTARVPMARASASMIVVLELALPADMADEGLQRSHRPAMTEAWDDAVWGALPPGTVVLLQHRAIYERALAARAGGTLRDDVTVIPTFARDAAARRALASDPSLVPLWRDLELEGAPAEASLSSLASERLVVSSYEPQWGKAIGKHLVPLTLLDRLAPEPRGSSDSRRALDAWGPVRDRLVRGIRGDRELESAAEVLLAARAELAAELAGDADLAARTADDARAFR